MIDDVSREEVGGVVDRAVNELLQRAGVGQLALKSGDHAYVVGEREGLFEVGGDSSPRIDADCVGDTAPVWKGSAVDGGQNPLDAPFIDGVVGGGSDVSETQSTHEIRLSGQHRVGDAVALTNGLGLLKPAL